MKNDMPYEEWDAARRERYPDATFQDHYDTWTGTLHEAKHVAGWMPGTGECWIAPKVENNGR